MRAVLDRCSDMEIHCQDGTVIKANAFTMISSCTVIRNMYEDIGDISKIPCPIEDSQAVEVAVDVIHGLRHIPDLTLEETELCHRGFEFLGCTILWKKLVARMWFFVSKTTEVSVALKFADTLLSREMYARDFLNKFKSLCPKWNDFKEVFRHITVSEEIAMVCMWRLCKYFPAHLVFNAVIDAIPPHVLTFDQCLKILGAYRTGVYHHPDEIVSSTNKILSKFKEEDRAIHLQTISDAFCMYECSPGSKLLATILTFSKEPRKSILLKMYDPFRGTKGLRIKRFLNVTVNTVDGLLQGTCDVERMDEDRYYPSTVLMRITTYSSDTPADMDIIDHSYRTTEAWREFRHIEHVGTILDLDTPNVKDAVDEAALQSALKSIDHLRYIRLDFFYGHGDIRSLPIF